MTDFRKFVLLPLVIAGFGLMLGGCDTHREVDPGGGDSPSASARQPDQQQRGTGQAPSERGEKAGAAVRPSGELKQDERYRTRTYPQSLEVGTTSRVHFDIVAGSKWKTNKEFGQWSVELTSPTSVSIQRTSFSSGEIDLSEDRARATTAVSIPESATPGESIQLDATATFSVCTDETCHVLRDQKLSFPLKFVQAEEPPPGGSGPRPYR